MLRDKILFTRNPSPLSTANGEPFPLGLLDWVLRVSMAGEPGQEEFGIEVGSGRKMPLDAGPTSSLTILRHLLGAGLQGAVDTPSFRHSYNVQLSCSRRLSALTISLNEF